jgi:hypothetical protein
MSNKGKVDKHDKYAININDKHEIEYWSTKFGVSAEDLLKAVEEVGNSSIDVKEHTRRKQ